MARISSYPIDSTIQDKDSWIGTESTNRVTRNFKAEDIANYVVTSTSAVTGSGTFNTIPLWTPDGTKLGDSIITQSDIGIDVISIGGRLSVSGDLTVGNRATFSGQYARFSGQIQDSNNSGGTAGQVLSSTGAGVEWISDAGGSVTGTGTANTIPLWTAGQVLGDSVLSQITGTAYGTTKNLVVDGNIYQSNMGNSVSIGENALANGVAGTDAENVAIGLNALNSLTTATNNIGIGVNTLQSTNANNNIAIGKNSQTGQTTGLGNISLGFNSLSGNNVGNTNIAIGHTAVQNVVIGAQGITDNVILGAGAVNATTITGGLLNSVIIGTNALEEADAANISSSVFIGNGAGRFIEANATSDIGIGIAAFYGSNGGFNSAGDNIAIGANANGGMTATGVRRSIKIGSDAGTAGSYAVNISAVNTGSYSFNTVTGEHAAIIGGANNLINGADAAFTGGGRNNTVNPGAIGGAIVGGYDNTVSSGGSAGMALGSNLAVDGENQVVVGRYNTGNNNSKFIVGAGFSNVNRINAFEVKNTSQLKLGKYGQTPANFPSTSTLETLVNVLVVAPNNNVLEIPITNSEFNSQKLLSSTISVTAGSLTNLGASESKIVKISWTGITGNAILRLPQASNFTNKTIRFITDSSLPATATAQITGNGGTETVNGSTAGVTLTGTYQATMVWSDGTEWWVL